MFPFIEPELGMLIHLIAASAVVSLGLLMSLSRAITKKYAPISVWYLTRLNLVVLLIMWAAYFYLKPFSDLEERLTAAGGVIQLMCLFLLAKQIGRQLVNPTPYMELGKTKPQHREFASRPFPDEDCDVFISYRSKDAEIVRAIAESLAHQGLKVWFAEYKILLTNYELFQRHIDQGIARCRFGLLFTNDSWARSKYCETEARQLIERLPPNRILQVAHPGHAETLAKFPELGRAPKMDLDPNLDRDASVSAVLSFLSEHTGILPAPQPALNRFRDWGEEFYVIRKKDYSYTINLWNFHPNPLMSQMYDEEACDGFWDSYVDGIKCHMLAFSSPRNVSAIKIYDKHSPNIEEGSDERKHYTHYIQFARDKFIKPGGYKERGLHLYFHEGTSQFAVTYSYADQGEVCWERRYVILQKTDEFECEIGILLSVDVTDLDTLDEAFERFLSITTFFDSVVSSVKIV